MSDLKSIRRFVVWFWPTGLVLLILLYGLHCGIKPDMWPVWIIGMILGLGFTISGGYSEWWRRHG